MMNLKFSFLVLVIIALACGVQNEPNRPSKTAKPKPAEDYNRREGADLEANPNSYDPISAPLTDEALHQIVIEDMAKQGRGSAANFRYISVAHLADQGPETLDTVMFGVTKALNSVSSSAAIVRLVPVDSSKTVYRTTLSENGLNAQSWSMVMTVDGAQENVTSVSGTAVAKGDWLVFALTRPEVYDKLVGVPALEKMLESKIGADRSKATYFGVNKSIVTYSGRMIERIPINLTSGKQGYYYRSYDWLFGGSATKALNSADVSYAAGRSLPNLIAGEFIWSLPNGLQAYMLSGFGQQHRYDADARVARDGRREDKLVINGESCMTCHANGVNTRKDEVRPAVMANPAGNAELKNALLQKFPVQAELDKFFAQDNALFGSAIEAMGFPSVGVEPIGASVDIYLRDRGLGDQRQQRGEVDAVFGG